MNNKLIEIALLLKKINNNFSKKKFRMLSNENIYNSKFLFFNFILNNEELKKSPYYYLILNYFKRAETLMTGSSMLLSEMISNKILGNINNYNKSISDKKLETILDYLKSQTDEYSFDLFNNLILFGGPDASINIEATKNSEILITKNCNPFFEIDIDNDFLNLYFTNLKKVTKDVILVVADAYIERETDIIRLFDLSKELNNLPIVLICRGISENIKNYIKQIILLNKIYLYPYISKFNDNDPFLFDDICKLNNQQKVSSDYGDILVKAIYDKHKISKIILEKNKISFLNYSKELFEEINNQIKNDKFQKNEETIKYLNKRKSRISPNNVKILIPETNIKLLLEIKNLIKLYNLSAIFGVYNNKINKENHSVYKYNNIELLSNSFYNNLINISYSIRKEKKQNE